MYVLQAYFISLLTYSALFGSGIELSLLLGCVSEQLVVNYILIGIDMLIPIPHLELVKM